VISSGTPGNRASCSIVGVDVGASYSSSDDSTEEAAAAAISAASGGGGRSAAASPVAARSSRKSLITVLPLRYFAGVDACRIS